MANEIGADEIGANEIGANVEEVDKINYIEYNI